MRGVVSDSWLSLSVSKATTVLQRSTYLGFLCQIYSNRVIMAASMSPYNDSKDHYVWQMFLSLFNLNIGLLIP